MIERVRMCAAAVAALGLAPGLTWAQQPAVPGPDRFDYGPRTHMMGWDGAWYGMMFGPLLMITILAIGIALAVFLVRGLAGPWHASPPPQHPHSEPSALDILKKRYARGEISKEEFEERRRVLGD